VPLRIAAGGASGQPVTFGVPLAPGTLPAPTRCRLQWADGASVPAQTATLCRWPDGSVRWLQVDAILPHAGPGGCRLELGGEPAEIAEPLSLRAGSSGIVVETGPLAFEIARGALRPFHRVRAGGSEFPGPASEIVLSDAKARRHTAECTGWRVETAGPLRGTVVGEGRFRRLRGLRCELRVSCFAGTGLLRLDATLHNPRRAKHRGGIWDLGDAGSVLFRDFSVEFALPADSREEKYALEAHPRDFQESLGCAWSLYQDSSGGEHWNSRNHVNREGRVPCRFQGYRLNVDGRELSGLRAEPTLEVRSSAGRVSLAMPEFWQQFPKAIEVNPGVLRVGLFPREFDDLHELQGGERKTHTLWLQFGGGDLTWVHSPAVVRPDVAWSDATGALPRLGLPASEAVTRFENYLEESLTVLLANREKVDEYGWRNYGDVFADHEQTYYSGGEPLISHYNNQFDMVHGFLLHFVRTGDRRWWDLGDALARHVADIDLYHTREDKAAYNGGLFWFTDHYLHAHTSTHRTYSRHNRPNGADYGGGPGAQHNFTSGLLLHHLLTGNPHSRDAVLQLADWVIAMDDGRRTVFGIVDDGATGAATGSADYQGPDRAGGNSINALLDTWRLSGRRSYLAYAELLIRRCVHPEDDMAALDLLDVEKRWSYTVFLTSLAKYLDVKAEARERDEMAAYAKCSLLRYAKWMVQHEKPYFDQVEKLEFPTEAWAAQEFRKANVLRLAAVHAEEPLRSSLLERGTELADRAWQDLLRFETRSYARATAIVMIEGLMDCEFRALGAMPVAEINGHHRFPARQQFVPQRRRIREGLRRLRGIASFAANGVNPQRWLRYHRTRRLSPAVNATSD